jgi:hypothetical protein
MEVRKVWYFYQTWYFVVPVVSVVLSLVLQGASTKPTRKQEPSQVSDPKKTT